MNEYYAKILANFVEEQWMYFLSHIEENWDGDELVAKSIVNELNNYGSKSAERLEQQ